MRQVYGLKTRKKKKGCLVFAVVVFCNTEFCIFKWGLLSMSMKKEIWDKVGLKKGGWSLIGGGLSLRGSTVPHSNHDVSCIHKLQHSKLYATTTHYTHRFPSAAYSWWLLGADTRNVFPQRCAPHLLCCCTSIGLTCNRNNFVAEKMLKDRQSYHPHSQD